MITFLRRRSKQAALTAFAVIAACESPVSSDTNPNGTSGDLLDSLPISLGGDTMPGTVSDLAVSEMSDTSSTLTFTEVDDGTGHPASYDVRYAIAPISWGSAQSVTHGTCSTPVAGTTVGARHTCVISSLTRGTNYQFQLVAYRGTLNVNAEFGGLSNVASGTTPMGSPGTVSDLTVTATTDTSATLSFSEVDDGSGKPASYDVRSSVSPISWGSAQSVTQGTCATPLAGTQIGAKRSCTVLALARSTRYDFQLVAFRGTLNVDATFGKLSAVASGTTLSTPVDTTTPPPPPPPSGVWPNQPAAFRLLNDQPWDALTGSGWNYLRRASSKDDDIISDGGAPLSPPDELRIVFTPDMGSDHEPSVHWISLPGVKEIYTAWWIKLSPNWTASPAGAGKITFLFTNGAGQVYTGYYHKGGDPSTGWIDGPPYRIGVNTEWAPYGQRVWLPNATTTFVNPGEWHRIEVYYRWETTPGVSNDGVIRWWVDGVLNGNYANVHYPAGSFIEYQYAPTLQNAPPAEQYMYVDHSYVGVP